MNQYLESYTVAVKHPDVSEFEHLDMLITRDKIATLEEQLTAEEKAKLATADQHLLNQANRFFAALATITDLQQERQKRQPLPSHWWWYLDVLTGLPTRPPSSRKVKLQPA